MTIGGKNSLGVKGDAALLQQVVACVTETVRETDLVGWVETDAVVGVLLTELADTGITAATNAIRVKVTARLRKSLTPSQLAKLLVTFHPFPDGWEGNHHAEGRSANPALHPSSSDRRENDARREFRAP